MEYEIVDNDIRERYSHVYISKHDDYRNHLHMETVF
jgi:hypothetical protein